GRPRKGRPYGFHCDVELSRRRRRRLLSIFLLDRTRRRRVLIGACGRFGCRTSRRALFRLIGINHYPLPPLEAYCSCIFHLLTVLIHPLSLGFVGVRVAGLHWRRIKLPDHAHLPGSNTVQEQLSVRRRNTHGNAADRPHSLLRILSRPLRVLLGVEG